MKYWQQILLITLLFLSPETVFADHYGLCEPPDCEVDGGGIVGALVGLLLLGALISIMSGVQKLIFITTWLGVVAISFVLGYKGFAVFWGTVGFWISFFLTSWISEKIEIYKTDKISNSSQDDKGND